MITSTVLYLLPLVALSTGFPTLPCNCGLGPGEDVCSNLGGPGSHKCTPLVVRPVDVPKPVLPAALAAEPKVVCKVIQPLAPPPPPLVPIPGPCGCKHAIVKPAVVPKPACTACGGYISNHQLTLSQQQQLTLNQQQQLLFGGGVPAPAPNPVPVIVNDAAPLALAGNPANFVPADPVSVHLARKMAQESACHLSEDKLSFGFRTIPKDIPLYIQKAALNIPEENLYSLNGQIVELKKPLGCATIKSLDEEAHDDLLQLAEEEEEAHLDALLPRKVSLGEIGYGPAKIKPPTFIDVLPVGPGPVLAPAPGAPLAGYCQDGFQPGNVIFKEKLLKDKLALPPVLPPPCAGESEGVPLPPPGAFYTPSYSYMASSSAAHAASAKKAVFMQKLGCGC